jgi:uncharacterized protein YkwD
VLSLVLGVSVAMLITGRPGGSSVDVGAAASIGSADQPGSWQSADRAARGEPRSVPRRPGDAGPGAGRATSTAPGTTAPVAAAVPARTLVPTPTPTPTPTPARSVSAPTAGSTAADEVVRLTNLERAKAGCGPLHVDARLVAAAQGHSEDMSNRNYFSHTTPEGGTPWDRAAAAGYPSPSAENIAMGYRTAADVVAGWMGSEGHRANILNCASHAVGVGYEPGGSYWTQMFGYV